MSNLSVPPDWLKARLGEPRLRVVDGSWYMPGDKRDPKAEFLAGHIPGAVHFDIDAIADHSTDLPHMAPSAEDFAKAAGDLGLSETDLIVVYDGVGLFSAARVWWTLRIFGATDVRILDGGLPAWKGAGYPLQTGAARPTPATFKATPPASEVVDLNALRRLLESRGADVVDARSAPRFRGEAPEPRPGIPSGHMPGAVNLPFDRLVDGGQLVAPDVLRARFEDAGVDLSRPVVTSCGSGVTAAVLAFALATLGKDDVSLYDGSWSEWASRPENPIATGPA